jgi:hypothetical protein
MDVELQKSRRAPLQEASLKAKKTGENQYTLAGDEIVSEIRHYLESEPASNLNVSRSAALAKNPAKVSLVVHVRARIADTYPIKQVDHINAKFKIHAFAEAQIGAFD